MFSECFTAGFKMELDEENESREQSTARKDTLLPLCNSIVTQSGLNRSDGKNTKTLSIRILAKILFRKKINLYEVHSVESFPFFAVRMIQAL